MVKSFEKKSKTKIKTKIKSKTKSKSKSETFVKKHKKKIIGLGLIASLAAAISAGFIIKKNINHSKSIKSNEFINNNESINSNSQITTPKQEPKRKILYLKDIRSKRINYFKHNNNNNNIKTKSKLQKELRELEKQRFNSTGKTERSILDKKILNLTKKYFEL